MTATLHVEHQILACCLSTPGVTGEVASIIHKPETFSTETNRRIYTVLLALNAQSYETDLVTVNNELQTKYGLLRDEPTGWLEFLTGLLPEIETFTGNLAKSCYWLIGEATRRTLMKVYSRGLTELQIPGSDPMALMKEVRNQIEAIESRLSDLAEVPFSESLLEAAQFAEAAAETGNPITGIRTGLYDYDMYTKGLHGGTFTIWAARPSMGKTAQLCQIAYNIACLDGEPVGVFSLEMKKIQLARRLLSIDSNTKNSEVLSGLDRFGARINIKKLFDSAGKMANAPLYVYDQIFSLDHIAARITQLATSHGVRVFFIDYIGLIETEDKDDGVRVARASRKLKKLANNLNVAIIALAQLNRKVEERANKRPQMSDLRDTGSLEQDADTIMFLYRPYYYCSTDANGMPVDPDLLYNIIPKNRHGSTHNDQEGIELKYTMATNRIERYSRL